jgi:HPt (histidine-containing phosphotransfer) domain-containing protein
MEDENVLQQAADTQGSSMNSDPHDPIDPQAWTELLSIAGSDPAEMIEELVGLYEEDAANYIATIRTSRETPDLDELRAAAHALKSPSATLGALDLAECCRRLELACPSEDRATLTQLIDELLVEFERALHALQSIREGR